MNVSEKLKNGIIVSCQASAGDCTDSRECMRGFIKSAIKGGAKGLRLANFDDIKFAKANYPEIPIIGLTKPEIIPKNFKELVYITPSAADAKKLIEAGADIIAFDATKRYDYTDTIKEIKEAGKLALADISTYEEAKMAQYCNVDFISTTLSGYTTYSPQSNEPDFDLIKKCVQTLKTPIFAEGKIWQVWESECCFSLGAHSVVIGSAITRPWLITERFVNGEIGTIK